MARAAAHKMALAHSAREDFHPGARDGVFSGGQSEKNGARSLADRLGDGTAVPFERGEVIDQTQRPPFESPAKHAFASQRLHKLRRGAVSRADNPRSRERCFRSGENVYRNRTAVQGASSSVDDAKSGDNARARLNVRRVKRDGPLAGGTAGRHVCLRRAALEYPPVLFQYVAELIPGGDLVQVVAYPCLQPDPFPGEEHGPVTAKTDHERGKAVAVGEIRGLRVAIHVQYRLHPP